jgi:hypothetical protein
METINIFSGIDGFENPLRIRVRRQRKLDEYAVDVIVVVQRSNQAK